jgi:predicted amidohydrolase
VAQIPEQTHLEDIESVLRVRRGSDLIVFPEGTLYVTDLVVLNELQAMAKRYRTEMVIGIIHKDKRQLYDYAYYISARQVERYQKVHVHWTEAHEAGHEFRVVKTRRCRIGLLMCYDAAFIEASRVLTLMGADVLVVISAIPIEFPARFATLRARATAYANQVYLVHCCRPGKAYSGRSAIIDPRGDVVMELGKYASVRTKTIDLKTIKIWREKEKTFAYRRPDMYRLISSLDSPV